MPRQLTQTLADPKAVNLRAICRECLDATPDAAAAARKLHERCLSDPVLLNAIVERRLYELCWALISQAASEDRSVLDGRRERPLRTISAGEFAGAVTLSLLDYRVGGRRLGDLRRSELTVLSDGLASQAQDAQIKSNWLRLIAQALPNEDKTVDEALTSDKLEELRTKAREQV
jgi:hypothetical protein